MLPRINSAPALIVLLLITQATAEDAKPKAWKLLEGKAAKGWVETDFAGQGEVKLEKGVLTLGFGQDLTGVTWANGEKGKGFKLPTENFEVELEAMRADGSDFFCGLTFPVGKGFASLIVGGWGGGVIGLSSIDGFDASENETTDYAEFENKRWYKIRLRVTDQKIEAWIDKKQVVEVEREGKKFDVRIEVEPSRPFGLATWQTTAKIRNLTVRPLEEKDKRQ